MWRINGVQYYRLLLIILIGVEVVVIIAVAGIMVTAPLSADAQDMLQPILLVGLIATVIMVANLVLYTLIYHSFSNRVERNYQAQYHHWLQVWTQALFTQTPPAEVPVNAPSANALAELKQSLTADEGAMLIDWAHDYGLIAFWIKRLNSPNAYDRIAALDLLCAVGRANELSNVLEMAKHERADVRVAAVQAAAKIVAQLPVDTQDEAVKRLSDILLTIQLPPIVHDEIYMLLDDSATRLMDDILSRQQAIPVSLLLATINAVGRYYQVDQVETLIPYLGHPDAAVRIAVLRSLAQLKFIPNNAYHDILACIRDDDTGVREQAVATLGVIPLHQVRLPLWLALGDDDWRVRFAAGRTLQHYRVQGRRVLLSACRVHPQHQARNMATQILTIPDSSL